MSQLQIVVPSENKEDISPGNKLYDDIKFVESHFGGTLPLEIVLDFGKKNGATSVPHGFGGVGPAASLLRPGILRKGCLSCPGNSILMKSDHYS